MKKLYPFKFEPVLIGKRWGGDALATRYGKKPADNQKESGIDLSHIGETFEIYDNGESASSMVTNGFLAGNDLYSILETYLGDLVGDNVYDFFGNQFPLLIKFLDIRERLSVQVHPTDEIALERYDSLGKTEFWYVVDAAPDAKVYMGFNRDVTAQEFYDACKAETAPSLMNVYNPKPGDCFYIKAGTVHAAEGNVLIAEVQENSDATLRLYDWGYENNPATRREMHLDEAIDCIDYCKYKADELYIPAARAKDVICRDRYFTIRRIELASEVEVNTDNYTSFIVYMCIDGAASLKWDEGEMEIEKGDTILVPASLTDFSLQPKGKGTILIEASIDEMKDEEE